MRKKAKKKMKQSGTFGISGIFGKTEIKLFEETFLSELTRKGIGDFLSSVLNLRI